MRHVIKSALLFQLITILASASQHTFSVSDDLLAFPQYEIHYPDGYIRRDEVERKLREGDEVKLSQNEIQHSSQASSSSNAGDATIKSARATYERMVLDGNEFLCRIPIVEPVVPKVDNQNETLAKAERAKELEKAIDRGWELLSDMQDNCIYYLSGWWSYSFCYGQGVKQFHQLPPTRGIPIYPPVEDPNVAGYELGMYVRQEVETPDDEEASSTTTDLVKGAKDMGRTHAMGAPGELVDRGESRYLVQRLGRGTKCDLTRKPREIEVQFHCNPHSVDRISLIKEVAICKYLMVVQTPRLCSDVAFMPQKKDFPNAIDCSPILDDDEIEGYEERLAKVKEAEKQESFVATAEAVAAELGMKLNLQQPQVVGDIVVGDHNRVPKGKKLEKGAIVGGGKETYLATVAKSDGTSMSEKELKKLGVADMKGLRQLKQKLIEQAQGGKWRLDIVDTPNGKEFRGIIEGDAEEEEKGQKATKDDKKKQKPGPEKTPKTAKDEAEEGTEEEYYTKDEL